MFENFDDLFNDFMDGKNEDPHLKRMRDLQARLNDFDDKEGDIVNPHEDELGEPDEVIEFSEGEYIFEKKIWNLEHGTMIKVDMISSPLDASISGIKISKPEKRNLSQELELAVREERYEDAVAIRDKINKPKKETKK